MEPLTGKQSRFLRSLGQRMAAEVSLGKAGATEAVLQDIRRRLEQRELIKVRLGEECTGRLRKQIAEQLAQAVGAALAGVVGRTALLYRPNPLLPEEQRIEWPA
jgi:RNA-binding protein